MTNRIPPGYKDAGKDVGEAGDFIIWKTILEVARRRKVDVVFVSGDQKTDWFQRSQSKALFPRFELVDEFRRISEGATFHILQFSEFLECFGADEAAIKEVQGRELDVQASTLTREGNARRKLTLEGPVVAWLNEHYSSDIKILNHYYWDFALYSCTSNPIGVHVSSMDRMSYDKVSERAYLARKVLRRDGGEIREGWIVLVTAQDFDMGMVSNLIGRLDNEFEGRPAIVAAKLDPMGGLEVLGISGRLR